jgi:hypothetical protein
VVIYAKLQINDSKTLDTAKSWTTIMAIVNAAAAKDIE